MEPKTALASCVPWSTTSPSRIWGLASSDETMTRPVSRHTTAVHQKVPVMAARACRAGLRVDAAAAIMGAEPRPDSLENRPRAQPYCSAIIRPEPSAPPKAALAVKALSRMVMTAGIRYAPFTARMYRQPPT